MQLQDTWESEKAITSWSDQKVSSQNKETLRMRMYLCVCVCVCECVCVCVFTLVHSRTHAFILCIDSDLRKKKISVELWNSK